MQDITEFDEFVRSRLSDEVGGGQSGHRMDGLAVDIALLAYEPAEWARHWADQALAEGSDPRRDAPNPLTIRQARRMLHAWAAPPEERLTVAEVWLAVNAYYPLLAAEVAPTASALDDVRSLEDRMS